MLPIEKTLIVIEDENQEFHFTPAKCVRGFIDLKKEHDDFRFVTKISREKTDLNKVKLLVEAELNGKIGDNEYFELVMEDRTRYICISWAKNGKKTFDYVGVKNNSIVGIKDDDNGGTCKTIFTVELVGTFEHVGTVEFADRFGLLLSMKKSVAQIVSNSKTSTKDSLKNKVKAAEEKKNIILYHKLRDVVMTATVAGDCKTWNRLLIKENWRENVSKVFNNIYAEKDISEIMKEKALLEYQKLQEEMLEKMLEESLSMAFPEDLTVHRCTSHNAVELPIIAQEEKKKVINAVEEATLQKEETISIVVTCDSSLESVPILESSQDKNVILLETPPEGEILIAEETEDQINFEDSSISCRQHNGNIESIPEPLLGDAETEDFVNAEVSDPKTIDVLSTQNDDIDVLRGSMNTDYRLTPSDNAMLRSCVTALYVNQGLLRNDLVRNHDLSNFIVPPPAEPQRVLDEDLTPEDEVFHSLSESLKHHDALEKALNDNLEAELESANDLNEEESYEEALIPDLDYDSWEYDEPYTEISPPSTPCNLTPSQLNER